MTQIALRETLKTSRKQCNNCNRWFERTTFPERSARCSECHRDRARELSRKPEQVQKRKERRANRTQEQREAERERGRSKYANRTPEQQQKDTQRRQSRKEIDNARSRELRTQSAERRSRQAFSVWKSMLKHKYRITPEIHQAIYEEQAGKCYFCYAHRPSRGPTGLVIDHDKENGFVRGLLCRQCNANYVDEYRKLPKEFQDSPLTNDYLLRGETGHYIESIRRHLASNE